MQLLEKKLNKKILILNNNTYKINDLMTELNYDSEIILIYYTNDMHFQLIGYFNNNIMQTLFTLSTLPKELILLYRN